MQKKIIIAVDGYSSCGKSTLARDVAQRLGFTYIDSGAMYRAAAYFFLKNKIKIAQFSSLPEKEQHDVLAHMELEFENINAPGKHEIFLNGENVEEEIRGPRVSDIVSSVSALPALRKKMVVQQRNFSERKSVVMDGRDIGTTVFPNADLKIFMTADIEVRAKRRFDELAAKGIKMTLEEVRSNIKIRDQIDTTREVSPLTKAHDAVVLDNTSLTRQQQLDFILKIIAEKLGVKA